MTAKQRERLHDTDSILAHFFLLAPKGIYISLFPTRQVIQERSWFNNRIFPPQVCDAKDKPGMTMFDNYCLVGLSLPDGYPTFRWDFRGGVQSAVVCPAFNNSDFEV